MASNDAAITTTSHVTNSNDEPDHSKTIPVELTNPSRIENV